MKRISLYLMLAGAFLLAVTAFAAFPAMAKKKAFINKEAFDKVHLVGSYNEIKGEQISHEATHRVTRKRIGQQFQRAQTKYGWYIRLENTIIADNANGTRSYFAYDTSGKALEYLPDEEAYDTAAEGPDRRVKVPESCIRCHERGKP